METPRTSIRQLRYFVAVARTGSMRAAAETLNISQPALSAQMKDLETILGIDLIDRHSRGISLTKKGRDFLSEAVKILTALNLAEQSALCDRNSILALRVGITPSLGKIFAFDLLKLEQEIMGVKFVLHEDISVELISALKRGDLDAVFCYEAPEEFEAIPLYYEPLRLVGRPDVCGWINQTATPSDLTRLLLVVGDRHYSSRKLLDRYALSQSIVLQISY